jgi:hypothetical protein
MNDLSTLKKALDDPPGFTPRDLDLDGIMQAGSRLRRRRRVAVGSASAAVVAVLVIGGSQLVPAPASTPLQAPPSTAASSSPANLDVPLGSVIDTGLATKGGEWVLYVIPITGDPGVQLGIMLGVRGPGGELTPVVEINKTDRPSLQPGFHEGEGAQNIDGRTTLTFGYYIGKPYRISAKVQGKPVSAHFKAWSADPSMTVFWFGPSDAGVEQAVIGMAAYDRRGKKMVAGNPAFGLG